MELYVHARWAGDSQLAALSCVQGSCKVSCGNEADDISTMHSH